MGKRIFFAIFGGIALCGLILVIVGFAMGGRPGGIGVAGGRLVYYTAEDRVPLGSLPGWVSNWRVHNNSTNVALADDSSAGTPASTPANNQNAASVAAPFTAAELRKMVVDISAGYVKVKTGDKLGLEVDGPMEYSTSYSGGTWTLTSHYEDIITKSGFRLGSFWWGGRDMTTTFTLTLPKGFDTLDVSLGMGEATIEGFTLKTLNCSTSMGSMDVDKTTAESSLFDVSMGEIDVDGFTGEDSVLRCNMGSIELDGSITGVMDVDCSMGDVEISLDRPADYGWSASVGLGNISIKGLGGGNDSHHVTGFGSSGEGGNQSARPYLKLNCGMGNINVKFNG